MASPEPLGVSDGPSPSLADLGPPIRMQDALRSHVSEIVRQKEVIRSLLEKFKLHTVLTNEKEVRSATESGQLSAKIVELEHTIEGLMEINEKYRTNILSQNKSKELFQAKVREIQVTIELLQQREKKTNEINAELKRERDLLQHDFSTLKERFEFEMKREAEAAKKRISEELAAAKAKSDNDTKEKALTEKAYKDDLLAIKRSSDLREREMAQRIKDDYVAKVEFQKLKDMFDAVVEDKRILEASVEIVELASKEKETRAAKAEEELKVIKAKLHESEKEMLRSKLGEERAVRELEDSKGEVSRALKLQVVNEERVLTLEREKSMLLSQVANLKFDNSRTNAMLAETKKAQSTVSSQGNPETSVTPAPASVGRALSTHDLR